MGVVAVTCCHISPGIYVCCATAVATPGYLFDEWNDSYCRDRAQRELSNLKTERCPDCKGLGHDGENKCDECLGWGKIISGRPKYSDLLRKMLEGEDDV